MSVDYLPGHCLFCCIKLTTEPIKDIFLFLLQYFLFLACFVLSLVSISLSTFPSVSVCCFPLRPLTH